MRWWELFQSESPKKEIEREAKVLSTLEIEQGFNQNLRKRRLKEQYSRRSNSLVYLFQSESPKKEIESFSRQSFYEPLENVSIRISEKGDWKMVPCATLVSLKIWSFQSESPKKEIERMCCFSGRVKLWFVSIRISEKGDWKYFGSSLSSPFFKKFQSESPKKEIERYLSQSKCLLIPLSFNQNLRKRRLKDIGKNRIWVSRYGFNQNLRKRRLKES